MASPPGAIATTAAVASLKRIGSVQRALVITVIGACVVAVAGLLTGLAATSDAEAFLAGEIDKDALVEAMTPYLLLSFVQTLAVLAAAVLTIVWMFRLASNHRALHRGATWGPGWAIGGWFLPPLLFVIPFLMFRELWKASDPDVPIGGQWRDGRVSPLVAVWFLLYSVVPLVLLAFQSGDVMNVLAASEEDLAQQLVDGRWTNGADVAVTVAGAAAFVVMARALGDRHERLTGERSV
jgi:hypothetical protein